MRLGSCTIRVKWSALFNQITLCIANCSNLVKCCLWLIKLYTSNVGENVCPVSVCVTWISEKARCVIARLVCRIGQTSVEAVWKQCGSSEAGSVSRADAGWCPYSNPWPRACHQEAPLRVLICLLPCKSHICKGDPTWIDIPINESPHSEPPPFSSLLIPRRLFGTAPDWPLFCESYRRTSSGSRWRGRYLPPAVPRRPVEAARWTTEPWTASSPAACRTCRQSAPRSSASSLHPPSQVSFLSRHTLSPVSNLGVQWRQSWRWSISMDSLFKSCAHVLM